MSSLWTDIGTSISTIATKVRKSASSQTVTVPKVADLTSKLSDALLAQEKAAKLAIESKASQPKGGDNKADQPLTEGQKAWNSVSDAAKTYALALKSKLAMCAATIGS